MNIKCILVSEENKYIALVFYKTQDIYKVLMKNDKQILFDCKCNSDGLNDLIENFKSGYTKFAKNHNKIIMNRWNIQKLFNKNDNSNYILPIINDDGMVSIVVQFGDRYIFKSSVNKFIKLIYNL